jgi:hypothetical protein
LFLLIFFPLFFDEDETRKNNYSVLTHRYHSCALFENGRTFCWGGKTFSYGQLGADVNGAIAGTCTGSCFPVASMGFIKFSDTAPVVQISTSDFHSCGKCCISRRMMANDHSYISCNGSILIG